MCRGAKHPATPLKSKIPDLTDPVDSSLTTSPKAAVSAASWVWEHLWLVAVHVASWWAVKQLRQAFCRLRPAARSKEAWSLEELGLTAEIGGGRTGRVYEGCINGKPVAVKVCSSVHRHF